MISYWDVERPRFQLEQGPKWLTIDPATGQLSGKPDRTGLTEVVVTVKLERVQRSLDPAQLHWGVEKITDTRVETVGTAQQAFVIATQP